MLQTFHVLLVEDDLLDITLTSEALLNDGFLVDLIIVRDGVEALDYLYRRPPYEEAVRPHMILLDLNMPRKGGHEVLADVKQNPALSAIPVIVLTTSNADEDVLKAYNLNANSFIRKPIEMERFKLVMHEMKLYWFDAVTLPPSQ